MKRHMISEEMYEDLRRMGFDVDTFATEEMLLEGSESEQDMATRKKFEGSALHAKQI